MRRVTEALLGMGLGAGLMYLLDPARGRRRRAVLRDKIVYTANRSLAAADVTARDVSNRSRGMVARVRGRFDGEAVSDRVLEARVRAALGRTVTHPHAIKAEVRHGVVTLSGPVLSDEVPRLLRTVRRVRGVREVEDALDAHLEPGNIPALQGQLTRAHRGHAEFLQTNWSPAARLAAALASSAAGVYGLRHGGLAGAALGAAGLGLLARAVTNLEYRRLIGVGAGRRGVDVQKTIRIDAPVAQVFEIWSRYENFPYFMRHVQEVRRLDEHSSRWVVSGPGGLRLEWEADLVSYVPNELFAWRSRPGSLIGHAGIVRFLANDDDTTTVDVKLTYNPVAGATGHAVLALAGADPRTQLDDDLLRMKTFIETGILPRDAARPPPSEALH